MTYTRFLVTVASLTVVMFGLMCRNTYALDHTSFSETRVYMALNMGAAMAAVMLLFMWKKYCNVGANFSILAGSAVLFSVSRWLLHGQETVQDTSWMKAMIPHHSIVIMTSERSSRILAFESWPERSSKPSAKNSAQWGSSHRLAGESDGYCGVRRVIGDNSQTPLSPRAAEQRSSNKNEE